MPDSYKFFWRYCKALRERIRVKGIMIYNAHAEQRLTVAGWPYVRISAVNDNGAKP